MWGLCPGYTPPDRHRIGAELLENVHREVIDESKKELDGKTVCISLDGWSNKHKESIIGVAVTSNYKTYIIDSVDSQPSHTGR